jgi:hypothetical protein
MHWLLTGIRAAIWHSVSGCFLSIGVAKRFITHAHGYKRIKEREKKTFFANICYCLSSLALGLFTIDKGPGL